MNYKILLDNYFPFTVRLILFKALLFYIIYKSILSLDLRFINYPLTTHVGEYSITLLNTFVGTSDFSVKREYVNGEEALSSQIYYKSKKVVYIVDSCNGHIVLLRYIGLIFCFPSSFWRKVKYIIIGLIIMHILNTVRCAGLAYINLNHQPFFNEAHNFWIKWIVYGPISIIWILYLRKIPFPFNLSNKKERIA